MKWRRGKRSHNARGENMHNVLNRHCAHISGSSGGWRSISGMVRYRNGGIIGVKGGGGSSGSVSNNDDIVAANGIERSSCRIGSK